MNIKLNEVRVGNWVCEDNGMYVPVGPDIILLIDHSQNIIVRDSDYSGIPITPDILTKSGFDARDASDEGYSGLTFTLIHIIGDQMDYFTLVKYVDKDEYRFEFYSDESSHIRPHRPLRYVHELQNLYFALYGEELNIVI
jgi:hypothetical protein